MTTDTAADAATDTATATGDTATAASEPAPIVLSDEERDLVAQDLELVLATLEGERRDRFRQLAAAVATGEVPASLAPALESLLELTLQTARARARYRAEGEKVLTELYRRTPAGRELSDHLGQVNAALKALAGHTVESVGVRMRTVGHFTVTIQTDGATITLAARPDSVDVESVSVGA
jgi:hypothetical protein